MLHVWGIFAPLAFCKARLTRFLAPTRIWDWWEFKTPVFLGVAYLSAAAVQQPLELLWWRLIVVVAALVPLASYVCVINEITDLEVDRLAGKSNAMEDQSRFYQLCWVLACMAGGAMAATVLRGSEMAVLCYLANWIAFTLYSVPPVRLKIRGLLGVVADACGGQLLPTLWTAVYVGQSAKQSISPLWVLFLGVWAFALGVRGILGHQLRDLKADRSSGVNTLVVRIGPERTLALLRWLLLPIELGALFLVAKMAGAWIAFFALAVAIAIPFLQQRMQPALRGVDPVSFALPYYLALFPVAGIVQLGVRAPAALLLLPLQVLLFPRCWRLFLNVL